MTALFLSVPLCVPTVLYREAALARYSDNLPPFFAEKSPGDPEDTRVHSPASADAGPFNVDATRSRTRPILLKAFLYLTYLPRLSTADSRALASSYVLLVSPSRISTVEPYFRSSPESMGHQSVRLQFFCMPHPLASFSLAPSACLATSSLPAPSRPPSPLLTFSLLADLRL